MSAKIVTRFFPESSYKEVTAALEKLHELSKKETFDESATREIIDTINKWYRSIMPHYYGSRMLKDSSYEDLYNAINATFDNWLKGLSDGELNILKSEISHDDEDDDDEYDNGGDEDDEVFNHIIEQSSDVSILILDILSRVLLTRNS